MSTSCSTLQSIIPKSIQLPALLPTAQRTIAIERDKGLISNIGDPLRGKEATLVREQVQKEERMLRKLKGVEVETLREGEVLKITIPASLLFEPNSTELWSRASITLRPFLRYLKGDNRYLLLIGTHSDNTGSEGYCKRLTQRRAIALNRWFVSEGVEKQNLIAYAYGYAVPREKNTTDVLRARNRRVELCLVPSREMINNLK